MPPVDEFSDLMSAAGDASGDAIGADYEAPDSDPTISTNEDPEVEYPANGKIIKEKRSMALKRAGMGYDYAQKMEEFNKSKSEFDTRYKTYEEIDQYAKTNPDWWNNVLQNYQAQANTAQQESLDKGENPALSPELQALKDEIADIKKFKDSFEQQKRADQEKADDELLSKEIDGIRQQYPQIDFNSLDENGKSLETRILKHAQDNGIKGFKTAFRDFYHDNLISLHKEKGKEEAVKDFQKKTKLGLLSQSTPTLKKPESIKNKSYNDLMDESLAELGLT